MLEHSELSIHGWHNEGNVQHFYQERTFLYDLSTKLYRIVYFHMSDFH